MIPIVQKRLHFESNRINLNGQKISLLAKSIIEKQRQNFDYYQFELRKLGKSFIKWKIKELEQYREKLKTRLNHILKKEKQRINYLENAVQHFNPDNVLKKGYSITKHNGKIITNTQNLKEGQSVETILYQGKFSSKVDKV
jgi:exodeoxyribonuclease VII large subunit